MLTQEQVASYHTNGYLGVEGVLPPGVVAELQRVTDEFTEKSRLVTENDGVFDLERGHSPETPRIRRLVAPSVLHPIYKETLHQDGICDIVSQLIGPSFRHHGRGKINMKVAEVGSPVEWHQDWAFFPHTNDDVLTVGVAIDDMTTQNGALLVLPGSHEGPIYDHHQDGAFASGITDAAFNSEGAVPIELAAGGISLHHVRTAHASMPNISGKPRRLYLWVLAAGDAWPIMGYDDWAEYAAKFVRGEPTNQPRMEALPVRLPRPGAKATVRYGSLYTSQLRLRKSFRVGQKR